MTQSPLQLLNVPASRLHEAHLAGRLEPPSDSDTVTVPVVSLMHCPLSGPADVDSAGAGRGTSAQSQSLRQEYEAVDHEVLFESCWDIQFQNFKTIVLGELTVASCRFRPNFPGLSCRYGRAWRPVPIRSGGFGLLAELEVGVVAGDDEDSPGDLEARVDQFPLLTCTAGRCAGNIDDATLQK